MGGIRKIERHEVVKLVPCARLFHDEAKVPGNFNADAFVGQVVTLFDTGNWFCFISEDEGGSVIAGIAGLVHPEMTTGELTCMEMFWFVRPDKRKGSLALKLLKAYEDEAVIRGARRILMTRIAGMNDGTLDALYERKGYREFERVYMKEN